MADAVVSQRKAQLLGGLQQVSTAMGGAPCSRSEEVRHWKLLMHQSSQCAVNDLSKPATLNIGIPRHCCTNPEKRKLGTLLLLGVGFLTGLHMWKRDRRRRMIHSHEQRL